MIFIRLLEHVPAKIDETKIKIQGEQHILWAAIDLVPGEGNWLFADSATAWTVNY